MKKIWFAIPGAAFLALMLMSVFSWVREPYQTFAIQGKEIAANLGCFACHGEGGTSGIPNVGGGEGDVPQWSGGTSMMYLNSDADIESYILKGHGASEKSVSKGLMQMPAYEGVVSDNELMKLVAYVKAVSNFYPEMPAEARKGYEVGKKLGCFGCHGPSGMGGIKNYGSFKAVIPALYGKDFEELCKNEEEIKRWILEGKIDRFQNNSVAMYFINRQKIKMPAYKNYIAENELSELLNFIRWLNLKGKI